MLRYLLKWGLFSAVLSIITFSSLVYILDTDFDTRGVIAMILAAIVSTISAVATALFIRIWPIISDIESFNSVEGNISNSLQQKN